MFLGFFLEKPPGIPSDISKRINSELFINFSIYWIALENPSEISPYIPQGRILGRFREISSETTFSKDVVIKSSTDSPRIFSKDFFRKSSSYYSTYSSIDCFRKASRICFVIFPKNSFKKRSKRFSQLSHDLFSENFPVISLKYPSRTLLVSFQ